MTLQKRLGSFHLILSQFLVYLEGLVQAAGKSDVFPKSGLYDGQSTRLFTSDHIRFVCPDIINLSAWVAVVMMEASVITYSGDTERNGDPSSRLLLHHNTLLRMGCGFCSSHCTSVTLELEFVLCSSDAKDIWKSHLGGLRRICWNLIVIAFQTTTKYGWFAKITFHLFFFLLSRQTNLGWQSEQGFYAAALPLIVVHLCQIDLDIL